MDNFGLLYTMAADWSVNGFLKNLNASLFTWGQTIVIIIGVVMVIAGVFNIAKGLMSGGRSQTNWVLNLALFFVGGALAFSGGWGILQDIGKGAVNTLNELGTGTGKTGAIILNAERMLTNLGMIK